MGKRYRKSGLNSQLDIIIPFWKGYPYLISCLQAVPDAVGDLRYQIILVDNGNERNDEHTKFFRQILPALPVYQFTKIVRTDVNKGFIGGINLGVQRGFSSTIFILTIDVVLFPDSVLHMFNEMQKDENIGVIGMKLLFPPDSRDLARPGGKIQHMGLHSDIRGNIKHTFIGWSPDNPRVNAIRDVYAVTGAAFMTRRHIWRAVGGFDTDYGAGTYGDVSYCLSVRDLGYNIIVDKDAMAYHKVGVSVTEYGFSFPIQLNKLKFLQKWGDKLKYTEYLVV